MASAPNNPHFFRNSSVVINCWQPWLEDALGDLRQRSLLRTLRPTWPGSSPVEAQVGAADLAAWVSNQPVPSLADRTDTRTVKLFSLNDYLGLSTHPRVCAAAADAARSYGNGPRSSALVSGYTYHHHELETALAALKGTEEALLFPTGFAANLALISALVGSGDVDIFSDELNHASIVDGARLGRRSGARLYIYRHNDLCHLESLLLAASSASNRRQLVITDSLFSMDGDLADLAGLAALRRTYGFLLAVDEAHATLVCGPGGEGAAAAAGVADQIDLHVGTLSKAFGCFGGFVACSAQWKQLLVNLGRAQVYSTALPVPIVAAATTALRVAQDEPWRRQHLWRLVELVGEGLCVAATSPIVPVVIGEERATMAAATELLQRGFLVGGIRPPTVPAGTSRLRLSLSAAHTTEDVAALVEAVNAVVASGLNRKAEGLGDSSSASDSIIADSKL